jgi:hypothetical protein
MEITMPLFKKKLEHKVPLDYNIDMTEEIFRDISGIKVEFDEDANELPAQVKIIPDDRPWINREEE